MQDRVYFEPMKFSLSHIKAILLLPVFMAILGLFSANAIADTPYPRLKPPAPNYSNYLSKSEAKLFRSGLNAIERRRWTELSSIKSKTSDPSVRDFYTWARAFRDRNAPLSDLSYVAHNLSDWPRMTTIRSRAEAKLFDKPLSASETISWFRDNDPVSGEGRAALARAYFNQGNEVEGDRWLKLAWREAKLTRDRQKSIYGKYKHRLTREDNAARADYLIWQGRGHYSKAQALLSLMNKDDAAVMRARMYVGGNWRGMDKYVSSVPRSLQNDPGLLYERARWRRRKKTKKYALPVYLQMGSAPETERGKELNWTEKKIMARWAIEEKKYGDAYQLTQHHGMERGTGFAEAEFLAGWLALTKLNDPQKAETHFRQLKDGVTFPVSLSRADYWLGRANSAMNNGQAEDHYTDAARFSNTFYGFLASDKLGKQGRLISLPYESDPTVFSAEFDADPRVRIMNLLGEAQKEYYFNQFAFHLDDVVESPQHLSLLSALGRKYNFMRPSVRAAKQASRFQTMLTESGYPTPEAITTLSDKFDKPFVLAIARQESEFNNSAVSHANAYGMMQMINSTAKATARKHRISYSRAKLTSDIHYSARLGALHLNDLLDRFDGSYIMAAAAYNAGASRVNRWIKDYGDPRKGDIDPIDWLESIPFTETRNYVQRVMENMQVYRARLNGNTAPNNIYRDITRGS